MTVGLGRGDDQLLEDHDVLGEGAGLVGKQVGDQAELFADVRRPADSGLRDRYGHFQVSK